MEVPPQLKKLVRLVMRGFYSIEHVLVMDMLIRKPCMREEDLEEKLRFERKQLRTVLAQLKNDKMIKAKLRMETGADGKATKQNYHYINYKAFVNVVKYKLDHMRRKIETEERDSTSRASFICTSCKKNFTDLEVGQLCNPMTGELRCFHCDSLVEEDPDVLPKADSRLILAKFNEQIEPLYLHLKAVEDLVLPSDLLEPDIADFIQTKSGVSATHTVNIDGKPWRESKTSNYDSQMLQDLSTTTVKIEKNVAESTFSEVSQPVEDKTRPKKEDLPWMKNSTVFEKETPSRIKVEKENSAINMHAASDENAGSSKEILEVLMNFEKTQEGSKSALSFLNTPNFGLEDNPESLEHSMTNNDEEELMDTDEEEVDDSPYVHVNSQPVRLSEIADEHIDLMSQEEKDKYIKLTQEMYSHMYEL